MPMTDDQNGHQEPPSEDFPKSYDRAVHSDYLIHWTGGKDIERRLQTNWYKDGHASKTNAKVDRLYLERLHNILKYGLWMTQEDEKSYLVGSDEIVIPPTPQCCFTELKLSESRRHAARYGRLGIGVKRTFLIRRYGRPLAYYGFGKDSRNDEFLKACARELSDKRLLNFFKPMNSDMAALTDDLYAESEWRILYFESLLKCGLIVDPRNKDNEAEYAYFETLSDEDQAKLKYLLPLDGWFTMIIYPSLSVKNLAQWDSDEGITTEIRRIKTNRDDDANKIEGGNWPIELDLDTCRHL